MNENHIEQIENYLNGSMSSGEKQLFESELIANKELNTLLSLYRTIDIEMYNAGKYSDHEEALKNTLQKLNTLYFKQETPVVSITGSRKFYRVSMSAAAGLILILLSYFIFFRSGSNPKQLADQYVQEKLMHLSQTMDGAKDSLQQGIAAYNNKDYSKALQLFEAIYQNHPENSDALKYTGTVYLVTKKYNEALERFDILASRKELFSNAGLFLKAITLIERNQPGDAEESRKLLQQVVDEKAEGSKEAAEWLKKHS